MAQYRAQVAVHLTDVLTGEAITQVKAGDTFEIGDDVYEVRYTVPSTPHFTATIIGEGQQPYVDFIAITR